MEREEVGKWENELWKRETRGGKIGKMRDEKGCRKCTVHPQYKNNAGRKMSKQI